MKPRMLKINGYQVTRCGDLVRCKRGPRISYCRRTNKGIILCDRHGQPAGQPGMDKSTKDEIQRVFKLIPEADDG